LTTDYTDFADLVLGQTWPRIRRVTRIIFRSETWPRFNRTWRKPNGSSGIAHTRLAAAMMLQVFTEARFSSVQSV